MVVALMACIAGLAFSGWLYTTEAYWGDATVEAVHRTLAWTLLALVCLHVAEVILRAFDIARTSSRRCFMAAKKLRLDVTFVERITALEGHFTCAQ
jgi:cytochrome b